METFDAPLDAVESVRERPPILVITDVVMKDIDGFELARRVRDARPRTPVLFMSWYNTETVKLRDPELHTDVVDLLAQVLNRVAASIERT